MHKCALTSLNPQVIQASRGRNIFTLSREFGHLYSQPLKRIGVHLSDYTAHLLTETSMIFQRACEFLPTRLMIAEESNRSRIEKRGAHRRSHAEQFIERRRAAGEKGRTK